MECLAIVFNGTDILNFVTVYTDLSIDEYNRIHLKKILIILFPGMALFFQLLPGACLYFSRVTIHAV